MRNLYAGAILIAKSTLSMQYDCQSFLAWYEIHSISRCTENERTVDKNTACLTSTLSAIGLHSLHSVVPKVIWDWYADGLHQFRSKLVVEAQTTLHLLAPCFGSLLDLPEIRTWRHLGSSPYVSGAAPKTKQHLSSCAQNAYTLCVSVFAEHFVLQCMWHLLLTCFGCGRVFFYTNEYFVL